MKPLSFEAFGQRASEFDRCVRCSPELDIFCSSSPWVLSAVEAFDQIEFTPYLWESEEGFVALCQGFHPRIGTFRQPLESSWCLASPFAGPRPAELVAGLASQVARADDGPWDLLFLSGLTEGSEAYKAVISEFGRRHFVGVGPLVARYRASLEGGVEGYLGRRSSKFRANLRRIERRGADQGVTLEVVGVGETGLDWAALYQRILAVEDLSWKGQQGTGIADPAMRRFYRQMVPRLGVQGNLRVVFLRHEGFDVGYIFGGVAQDTYRGLQVSFDADYRHLSLGNLAQFKMVQLLCEEGIKVYDLGSELQYKAQWAEQRVETLSLVVRPW